MHCPKCGVELAQGAVFCHRCGVNLDECLPSAAGNPKAPDGPSVGGGEPSLRNPIVERQADRMRPPGSSQPDGTDDVEIELWRGAYSSKAMIPTWIGAGVLTLVALVAAISFQFVSWGILLGVLVLAWIGLLLRWAYLRMNVRYRLTSQRLVHQRGILRRVTDRIEAIDIDDVAFEQGLIDRFVGVGTIVLTSSDRSDPVVRMTGIENVEEVAEHIDNARRRERIRRGLHIEAI